MATQLPDRYSYILMADVQGEKATRKFMAALGRAYKPVQVLQGELLTLIPSKERVPRTDKSPTHNYCSRGDPSVTLYGGEEDKYVSPLSGKELALLEAIEKLANRFDVFLEKNKLEWGSRLDRGDQVYAKIPSSNASIPIWSVALVKYAGCVEALPGWNFGIEIKVHIYCMYSMTYALCVYYCLLAWCHRIPVTLGTGALTASLGDTSTLNVIPTVVSLCLWTSYHGSQAVPPNHAVVLTLVQILRSQLTISLMLCIAHPLIDLLLFKNLLKSMNVWLSTARGMSPFMEQFAG